MKKAKIQTGNKEHLITVSNSTLREMQKRNVNIFCQTWRKLKENVTAVVVAVISCLLY